jgi:hypothetical protein
MFCEPYRTALSEAALRGEGLSRAVEAHLAACAACRAALVEEQALAVLVDGGLRTIANAQAPASLLPRVRAQIAERTAAPARGLRAFGLAVAALAMAVVAVWLSEARRNRLEEASPRTSALPAVRDSAPSQSPASTGLHREKAAAIGKKLAPRVAAHAEPLVLVSPEERAGLERYLATLSGKRQNRGPEAAALLRDAQAIEPLEITAMDLKAMTTEPLDSGGSK